MLTRLTAVLIVAFWVTMWTLLIRTEVRPQGSALREVPLEHVVKLMFHHGQPSDFVIHSDSTRVGTLLMLPHIRKEDGQRLVELTGSIEAHAPGSPRQRISWDGTAELTPELELEVFRLGSFVREAAATSPPTERFELTVHPRTRRAQWQWRSGSQLVEERSYALDETGLRTALSEWNIDPALLRRMQGFKAPPPRITAHQSTLRIREESAETFLITIEYAGQTWLECHVSQLGQVMHARTLVGWTLSPE